MTITRDDPVNRFVIADSTVCIGCRTCEAAVPKRTACGSSPCPPARHVMKKSLPRSSATTVKMRRARGVCPVNAITALTARYS